MDIVICWRSCVGHIQARLPVLFHARPSGVVPKLCTSVATGSPPASAPVLMCNCPLRGRPLTSGAWYQTCGFAWSFRVEAPFRPGRCHVMGGLLCPVWHLMSPCGGLPSQRCDDRKSGVRRLLGSRQSSAHDCHGDICWWLGAWSYAIRRLPGWTVRFVWTMSKACWQTFLPAETILKHSRPGTADPRWLWSLTVHRPRE